MEQMSQNCSVCLHIAPDLRKITEIDESSLPVVTKLKTCVSEIEWKSDYMICTPCNTDLDLAYQFRAKCLQSDVIRNQTIPTPVTEIYTPRFKCRCGRCGRCDTSFGSSSPQTETFSVDENDLKAEDPQQFMCRICNTKFKSSNTLTQHLRCHYGHRSHVCTFCGKGYFRKSDLNVHEKIHLNKKEYKCELCSKSFNTHKDLRSHKYVVHTDPSVWQHVCEICWKRFPVKTTLDAHVRRHKNERPYACHLCDKKFVVKSVLQKHFLSHTNERAFVCDICDKEYKDKRVMALHKKKIHDVGDITVTEKIKRHLCHLCPKAFYDQNKLTRHLSTHTGEKPFVCRICNRKFSDRSYGKQHMKKSHDLDEDIFSEDSWGKLTLFLEVCEDLTTE